MYNIFTPIEVARLNNSFTNGLSRYTQANMQITLENGLYHVYSPPNLTTANNGNTMWGGLKIDNLNVTGTQLLTKGHTYIIKFHVFGKCSRSPEKFRWSYEMGWEGDNAGLLPRPTNVTSDFIPNPFNGSKECFYKFTVSDDIYKTCSKTFGNYIEGQQYLSYKEFCFNYPYGNTGELGVDLYLSDFRMYDLTNSTEKIDIEKTSVTKGTLYENDDYSKVSMYQDTEILCNTFYEV